MAGRWNLLIMGESHLSSICTGVGMENHLLRKFENVLGPRKLAGLACKPLRIDKSVYLCMFSVKI